MVYTPFILAISNAQWSSFRGNYDLWDTQGRGKNVHSVLWRNREAKRANCNVKENWLLTNRLQFSHFKRGLLSPPDRSRRVQMLRSYLISFCDVFGIMSWAANQVIQFPQRELWTKSELRPEQKEKMVLEVNDCVVNEMSHMLFSVFRCSYTAYQYTTVSVKNVFTRTTRLALCQITMSSKQPWKKNMWKPKRHDVFLEEVGAMNWGCLCPSGSVRRLSRSKGWGWNVSEGQRRSRGNDLLDESGVHSLKPQLWWTGHVEVSTSSYADMLIQSPCFVICRHYRPRWRKLWQLI